MRVQPSGAKTFCVVQRDPRGKQHWRTIGAHPALKIDQAREAARKTIRMIREAPPDSFEATGREWFKRHVQKRGLRSAPDVEAFMNRHLFPAWGDRDFRSIGRADVAKFLDHLEDNSGARLADYALAVVRQIFNWQATRDENYRSPVVKGMRRTTPKERERARVLNDLEIRGLMESCCCDPATAMGAWRFLRFLLVTGQRRAKAADDAVGRPRWRRVEDQD